MMKRTVSSNQDETGKVMREVNPQLIALVASLFDEIGIQDINPLLKAKVTKAIGRVVEDFVKILLLKCEHARRFSIITEDIHYSICQLSNHRMNILNEFLLEEELRLGFDFDQLQAAEGDYDYDDESDSDYEPSSTESNDGSSLASSFSGKDEESIDEESLDSDYDSEIDMDWSFETNESENENENVHTSEIVESFRKYFSFYVGKTYQPEILIRPSDINIFIKFITKHLKLCFENNSDR